MAHTLSGVMIHRQLTCRRISPHGSSEPRAAEVAAEAPRIKCLFLISACCLPSEHLPRTLHTGGSDKCRGPSATICENAKVT